MKLKHLLFALLITTFAQAQTVVDIIVNSEDHTILEAAVLAAQLDETLSGDGPFTIFAPTDDAFAALPEGTIDALLADPQGTLTDILLYHAVSGSALSTDLEDGQTIATINGKEVTIGINMDGIFINNAMVTVADLQADNGVVHVINTVLLPPPSTVVEIIQESPDHTVLETALLAAGLDVALSGEGPFTIFAPTDAAFGVLTPEVLDQLLADPTGDLTTILQYHASNASIASTDLSDRLIGTSINGYDYLITINTMGAFVNDAMITAADLIGSNGIVHVIDAILIPSTTASVLLNSEDFSILSDALEGTGLIANLADLETRTTLFAPSNEAFAALPEDILATLIEDPEGKLTDALLYHVTAERTFSDQLSDGQELSTLLGQTTEVSITEEGVFINNAQVIITDFFTGNGLIHAIDAVLLPQPSKVMDVIIQSDQHNTLQAAIEAANLNNTLQEEGTFTIFAPTDAAFGLLPEGTVEALLEDPEGDLTDILLYHVLGTEVLSSDLSDGASAETLNGAEVNVEIIDDNVFINDAMVVIADILTDNGIVHVIDMVLLPPTSTNEFNPDRANIFPNPTPGMITLDFEAELFENPRITVMNTDGQIVKSLLSFRPGSAIDLSDLTSGMYMVVIADNKNSILKRVTKLN